MTKHERARFIEKLIGNIRVEILDKVEFLPEEWDGIELRRYVADKFHELAVSGNMERCRVQAYKNEIVVRNL